MHLLTEPYATAQAALPAAGRHLVAHQTDELLVVYQAYKPAIAHYAVTHQCLGGADFSYDRMSWIKPGFLWMMYRCGWARKEDQERVLALWVRKADVDDILRQAVHSAFKSAHYASPREWQQQLKTSEVRLQWDPDHDPYGHKLERRVIQLGLRGEALTRFGRESIRHVADITDFIREQHQQLLLHGEQALHVPIERVYYPTDPAIAARLGLAAAAER